MDKLVTIDFRGNIDVGFDVRVNIGPENGLPLLQIMGNLPPAAEIYRIYQEWNFLYKNIVFNTRVIQKISNHSYHFNNKQSFLELSQEFALTLNKWLDSNTFLPVKNALISELDPCDEIRVILQFEDKSLEKIPWHLWSICEYLPKSEITLGALQYKAIKNSNLTTSNKVRILVVIGDDNGIDLLKDISILGKFSQADTKVLIKPTQDELHESLWDEVGWDIFYFSGHSFTEESSTGTIRLNNEDELNLIQIKYALSKAIQRGLGIAIFNSCEGLGLANFLISLHIPQVIVMRERIPDLVAHEFLLQFLTGYSGGKSFYLSLREARDKLQGLESKFPCASWLPILVQNPAVIAPYWHDLCPSNLSPSPSAIAIQQTTHRSSFFKTVRHKIFRYFTNGSQHNITKTEQNHYSSAKANIQQRLEKPGIESTKQIAEATAQILKAVEHYDDVVLLLGKLIVMKYTSDEGPSKTYVKTISTALQLKLESTPQLLDSPQAIINFLKSQEEFPFEIEDQNVLPMQPEVLR